MMMMMMIVAFQILATRDTVDDYQNFGGIYRLSLQSRCEDGRNSFYETSVNTDINKWRHIPEDLNP